MSPRLFWQKRRVVKPRYTCPVCDRPVTATRNYLIRGHYGKTGGMLCRASFESFALAVRA